MVYQKLQQKLTQKISKEPTTLSHRKNNLSHFWHLAHLFWQNKSLRKIWQKDKNWGNQPMFTKTLKPDNSLKNEIQNKNSSNNLRLTGFMISLYTTL